MIGIRHPVCLASAVFCASESAFSVSCVAYQIFDFLRPYIIFSDDNFGSDDSVLFMWILILSTGI